MMSSSKSYTPPPQNSKSMKCGHSYGELVNKSGAVASLQMGGDELPPSQGLIQGFSTTFTTSDGGPLPALVHARSLK